MCSKFYLNILDEDIKRLNIRSDDLKSATKTLTRQCFKNTSKKGPPTVDFSIPVNCYAYIYKYSPLYTNLVAKYFRKLLRKKEIKHSLNTRKQIKICCLGGGPGTDAVGVIKALAYIPHFQWRLSEVSVLDKCQGWQIAFQHIMESLVKGKLDTVPQDFISESKFKMKFINVDLLEPLPRNAMEIMSNADIITMVNFLSEVQKAKECSTVLQQFGSFFKPGAIVLCIDRFEQKIMASLKSISQQTGVQYIMEKGPETFTAQSKSKLDVYGCVPHHTTVVSVVGMTKVQPNLLSRFETPSNSLVSLQSETSEVVDYDSSESFCDSTAEGTLHLNDSEEEDISNGVDDTDDIILSDQYTQTDLKDFPNWSERELIDEASSASVEDLLELAGALTNLLCVMRARNLQG